MHAGRSGRALPPLVAFCTAAGVLVVALWASGAPSMVYPVLAARWGVGQVVMTALFATYPVALVVALVACGSLSDVVGRRGVLLVGVSIIAVGTALFVLSDGMLPTFTGRVLQGAGVGVVMGAASAALLEFAPSRRPLLSASVNTAATAGGTAVALLLGGALVQYSTLPTRAPFVVLLGATVGLLPLLWFLPASATQTEVRWRPSPPGLPTTHRLPFTVGVVTLTVAFMMGAVFIGLGAQICREVVGTRDVFAAALALASWAITIIPASVVARRGSAESASIRGSALSALGLLALIGAASADSLAVFLVAAVVSGAGYGLMFFGGLGMVLATAEAKTRAATLSTMYLAAYLAQGVTAVGIGWLANAWGLDTAIFVAVPAIAALCGASGISTRALTPRCGRPTNPR